MNGKRKQKGSVLIFSLWALAFLSVFAVQIGMRIRQRATLVVRLEERSQLRYAAEAGIKKAISALKKDAMRHQTDAGNYSKKYLFNNEDIFKNIGLGNAKTDVFYTAYDGPLGKPQKRHGFVDGASKLNINTASKDELARLIQNALNSNAEDAKALSRAILGWRQLGEGEMEGFYSDDFYASRPDSYSSKDTNFEVLDELLLVKGFNNSIFEKILPDITVYGNGLVNINTTSRKVLSALGLSDSTVDKILLVRRGADQVDATGDDYIFKKAHDIASEMLQFIQLEMDEIKEIDRLNQAKRISTADSSFYFIVAKSNLEGKKQAATATCVYNLTDNKIVYWREKFEYLVASQ